MDMKKAYVVGILAVACGCSTVDRDLRYSMTQRMGFGDQPIFENILMGVPFSPPDSIRDAPSVPQLTEAEFTKIQLTDVSEAFVWGARGQDREGSVAYVFDRDGDGDLSDEELVATPDNGTVEIRWRTVLPESHGPGARQTGFDLRVLLHPSGRAEMQVDNLRETELQVGEEILRVGIQRLTGNAFLAFADADGDGTYDHPSRGGC